MIADHPNESKRKNIIILGSGRSGTSTVAGMFAQSGYFMGKNLYPGRDSNPKGFFEDSEINNINENILSLIQPDWAHPGQQWLSRMPLSTLFSSTRALDQRIQDIIRIEPFCLKDPRFSYTLPVWRPFLKNTVCICVFRDPASTVQSILKECEKYYPALPMNREIALQAWAFMYQHIAARHRHQGEWFFVHYDQLFDAGVQARLEQATGAALDRSFPDRSLKRSGPDFTPPPEIEEIYRNLCELADYSPTRTTVIDVDQVYEKMIAGAGLSLSDLPIAISAFLSQYPDYARAHNDMGVILYQQGDKQQAVRQYEHAVQLSPNNVTFLKNLADYYYIESRELRKALWLYQRILSLCPNDVEGLVNAGSLYFALQQPSKASTLLQKALLLAPQNQQAAELIEHIQQAAEEQRTKARESKAKKSSAPQHAEPAVGGRPHPPLSGKLVMTLLVRDEEDIVEKNIEFHLRQGVDFIIATDNGSVDRTKDILSAYARQGKLLLIEERSQDYAQADWVNRMAQLAFDEYRATYIFHCDADEFWSSRSGNLKMEIANRKENVLIVPLINVLLRSRSKQECFPEDAIHSVVRPKITKNLELDSTHENLYLFEYPPKVLFTTVDGLFNVVQGNHNVVDNTSVIRAGSTDITIYHFPIRSYRHFRQKVINGGSSYERNLQLGKSIGFHWRKWFESYRMGTFDQEYNRLVLDDEQAKRLTRIGVVEPFSFSALHKNGEMRCCRSAWG